MTTPAQTKLSLSFKGVNYVADVYGSYATANSLSSVVAIGANAIAVTADFGIDAVDSTVYANSVAGGYTESVTNVGNTIADAVNDGLTVMYRPLIDFLPSNYLAAPGQTNPLNGGYSTDEWRGDFNPGAAGSASANTFFASYQTMIVQQATVAQADGATLFCIGTELDQLTGPAYESYWDNIITAVRAVFSGKLTYAAEWDDALSPWQYGGTGLPAGTGIITTQVSFWSHLDYVGIDEYAPISDAANPTLAQLVAGWTQTPTDSLTASVTGSQSLISYYEGIATTAGKPLLFTELGYANSSDAASSPATPGYDENGNPDGATADPTLQANLYQAFFQAWQQDGNATLSGVYSWDWEPGGSGVSPFSVQGLPAETQLQDGYTACLRAGTRVRTARGDVAVETLHPGERVVSAFGGSVPVVWLGHRRVDCRRHPRPHDVWPVHVRPGAFGRDLPAADLWLSPDHAVFVDGVLIPVRYLINAATIVQEPAAEVTYWHVDLPSHDVILAENLPCESYLDTGNRGAFDNGGSSVMLHPDFALAIWQAEACAHLAVDGPAVVTARQRLLDRAAALGWTRTADSGLRVFVGRRVLEAVPDGEGFWLNLPDGAAVVRLLSRHMVPAHLFADASDTRELGLAVASVALDGEDLALDDPHLAAGWHAPEPGLRWTNGAAVLRCAGASLLSLQLAALPQYWVEPERTDSEMEKVSEAA